MDNITIDIIQQIDEVIINALTTEESVVVSITSPINGREIELRKYEAFIQWRYVNDLTWIDLIPLSDLNDTEMDGGSANSIFDEISDDFNCGGA